VKATKSTAQMDTAPSPPRDRGWPRLDLPHVLWFFGAITAAVATIAVLDKVPESSSDVWLLLASLGFLVVYALAALLLHRRSLVVPAGLMATVSAAMVPAVGYAFTQLIGTYPTGAEVQNDFSGTIFGIGLATSLVALLVFLVTRFTFVLALFVGAALVTVQLLVPAASSSGDDRALAGVLSGAVAVGLGVLLDATRRRREAFWFYVGGYLSIAISIVYYILKGLGGGGASGAWVALLLVGAAVLLGAAFLRRSTWATYGALGLYAALYHYLAAHDWVRYLLLAVSLVVFVLGLAVAARPRDVPPTTAS
jgi:hypothetical protein